jgi:hypothetical protein
VQQWPLLPLLFEGLSCVAWSMPSEDAPCQHLCPNALQPSWRAVAAALPSMPGGADICLADVELMARLAPDVLILRQDLGWGHQNEDIGCVAPADPSLCIDEVATAG